MRIEGHADMDYFITNPKNGAPTVDDLVKTLIADAFAVKAKRLDGSAKLLHN